VVENDRNVESHTAGHPEGVAEEQPALQQALIRRGPLRQHV